MKIKSLMATFVATAAMIVSFSSCGNNDDPKPEENIRSEYSLNDEIVKVQKSKSGKTKAVLLVAFGSTWSNAFKAFDETKKAYEAEFPDADVYLCFSSDICINRAEAGEGGEKRNYYEPRYLLHAIGAAKYSKIYVQSLQVIPGEEFANVVACVKKFMNNGYISGSRLDDAYLKQLNDDKAIFLGMPLLNDPDEDVPTVAEALHELYKDEEGIVAFMGHGNPDTYDTFKANERYKQLQDALQAKNETKYFVGTVDAPGMYKPDVLEDIKNAYGTIPVGMTINLHALMSIAGDHAHNDMAGEGEEYWNENKAMDEKGGEDNSWFEYFKFYGLNSNVPLGKNEEPLGLLELESIRQVWIEHTKEAEFLEDAYHSMYPQE